jgi:type IV pilus assembly protein PilX
MTKMTMSKKGQVVVISQKGSALLVSLIMLLLITLVAVGGMQSSILQEKMTGNMRDRDLAFQAAEAALREAESSTLSNSNAVYGASANGLYQANSLNLPDWSARNMDEGNGSIVYGADFQGVVAQPEYFIERLPIECIFGCSLGAGGPAQTAPFYRITARGFGGSANTVVVLSSVYQIE